MIIERRENRIEITLENGNLCIRNGKTLIVRRLNSVIGVSMNSETMGVEINTTTPEADIFIEFPSIETSDVFNKYEIEMQEIVERVKMMIEKTEDTTVNYFIAPTNPPNHWYYPPYSPQYQWTCRT